nr:MAG TPA: hypothetical protein [Caudoviricetes sp.]
MLCKIAFYAHFAQSFIKHKIPLLNYVHIARKKYLTTCKLYCIIGL